MTSLKFKMRIILVFLLVVHFLSYVESAEEIAKPDDKINCFKYHVSQSYMDENVLVSHSYKGSKKECEKIVNAEAEKYYNNITTMVESVPEAKKHKECMIKFIKDLNVSDVAIKDHIYNKTEEKVLDANGTSFLLKMSYFYCHPDDLLKFIFEIVYKIDHQNLNLKTLAKVTCLLADEFNIFNVSNGYIFPSCEKINAEIILQNSTDSENVVNQMLLFLFAQKDSFQYKSQYEIKREEERKSQTLKTIKSCLEAQFQERGYINNTSYKPQLLNCDIVLKPIQKASQITFQELPIKFLIVAKITQCFLYDIVDEDFLYRSLFHIMQTDLVMEEQVPKAEEEMITFVTTNLKSFMNCLVNVKWKIETILILYKYLLPEVMKNNH